MTRLVCLTRLPTGGDSFSPTLGRWGGTSGCTPGTPVLLLETLREEGDGSPTGRDETLDTGKVHDFPELCSRVLVTQDRNHKLPISSGSPCECLGSPLGKGDGRGPEPRGRKLGSKGSTGCCLSARLPRGLHTILPSYLCPLLPLGGTVGQEGVTVARSQRPRPPRARLNPSLPIVGGSARGDLLEPWFRGVVGTGAPLRPRLDPTRGSGGRRGRSGLGSSRAVRREGTGRVVDRDLFRAFLV